MAEQDAVDEGADGGLFVGVEVGEGLEAELPHVVGGGVGLGLPLVRLTGGEAFGEVHGEHGGWSFQVDRWVVSRCSSKGLPLVR